MRTFLVAAAVSWCVAPGAYAQSSDPAPAPPAPVAAAAPAEDAAAVAARRVTAAVLNTVLVQRLFDALLPTLPARFDQEFNSDPAFRRLPEATRQKFRDFLVTGTPPILQSVMAQATLEAQQTAAADIARTHRAEDLAALATFFESPEGVSVLRKMFGMAAATATSGSTAPPAPGDYIAALSGDEIKAFMLFMATPAGAVFQRDGDRVFKQIGDALEKSLEAQLPTVERRIKAGLCTTLEPAELRRIGAARDCANR